MAMVLQVPFIRKILAPIKIPPPPQTQNTPPLKRGILWTWVFLQKERILPGVHKVGAAISSPRIADKNFTDTRIFLILESERSIITIMNSTSRCSSRCTSRCAIQYGYGAWAFPYPAILRLTPKIASGWRFFLCGRRSAKPCDFCSGMVASPLVATVVTAILRCDSCAAKYLLLRRPTMEPFFCQKITAISRLLPLEFWCSEGHFAQFELILTLF